jgi:hypothetical protein
MIPSRSQLGAVLRAVFAGGLLTAATLLAATEGGFSSRLSTEQLDASGVARLTAEERAALDQIVATESSELRLLEGRVLSGTFASRRTAAEFEAIGLDRFTPDELAKLNELAASADISRPKPKERPRLKSDDVISTKRRPEVHGSLTLTYGQASGGRSFRGAALWLDYYIPEWNLSLGVGLSRYSGDALYGYYPGVYEGRYFRRDPFLFDAAQPGAFYGDFPNGTGETFRVSNPWGSLSYSRHHH